ncbi:MAG TPA: PEP-CTERM sorting domain-containing protein [Verrucomicrobiae bacterium]|nr:PEP-CTERM sorting domain-containing protein [Verrucomicrobiae bacterium]
MNIIIKPLRLAILWMMLTGLPVWSQGVIIWNGPVISFDHPADVGTSVQDQLTPGVWLTRDLTQGLINAFTETAYTHVFSPQDTEWAFGSLADYASLGYANWETWNGGKPAFNIVGQPAVVHLISENIYLSLTFTSWGGLGGAFSYDRSTPSAVPEPSVWALSGLAGCCGLMISARRKHAITD